MRIFAFVSLLAVLSPPDCCERRNTAVCSNDPGFECGEGQICSIPQGESVGMCMAVQCTPTNNTCPDESPICAMGSCIACAGDKECTDLNRGTDKCDLRKDSSTLGNCVECLDSSNCTAEKPVCDTASNTCRACQLHKECGSGVCAKDDAFASLATDPIPKGSCVPAGRVKILNPGNFASLNSALQSASPAVPYVLIKDISGSNGTVAVPSLPPGLPTFYLIGPIADSSPSKQDTQKPPLTFPGNKIMTISQGASIVIEGMLFASGQPAIECIGNGTLTTLRVVRSSFSSNPKAIVARSNCDVHVDSSWFGRTPFAPNGGNTVLSMDIDSSGLEVVNSVFLTNGSTPNNTGGIQITNTGNLSPSPLVRIVNSSFVDMKLPSSGHNALAIDCTNLTAGRVSIVNTLFLNDMGPTGLNTYVYSNCRQDSPTSMAGVASNDQGLGTSTTPNTVRDASLAWSGVLVAPGSWDVHYLDTAPVQLTAGGVSTFTNTAPASNDTITAPTVDMEGKARPAGQISIGALQK